MLKAVGLEEYMELFVEHRVQGDVIFNLTEENLKEMGVDKVWPYPRPPHAVPPLRALAAPPRPYRLARRGFARARNALSLSDPLHPSASLSRSLSRSLRRASLALHRALHHSPSLSISHALRLDRVALPVTVAGAASLPPPPPAALQVGDRLLITDITQTLYEQVTGWQEQKVAAGSPQLLQLGQ